MVYNFKLKNNNMFKKSLILIIFIIFSLPVAAQQSPQLALEASSQKLFVGDIFELKLVIGNIATNGTNLGGINIPGVNNFANQGSSQSTRMTIVNGASLSESLYSLKLKADKPGEFTIGPVSIEVRDENGVTQIIGSNHLLINVEKAPKASLNNIKSQDEDEENKFFSTILEFLKYIFAFILLLILLYYFKKNQTKINAPDYDDELENDKKMILPNEADEKFYEKIKKLTIDHCSKKIKIDLAAKTSQEIAELLKEYRYYKQSEVKRVLELCDMGRFGGSDADKKEILDILKIIL
jgi:hypothetical protein